MQREMMTQLGAEERTETEADLQAARTEMAERVRYQMSFAEKAMAAIMLANGGALIALFTFIGNTVGKANAPIRFTTSLIWAGFVCFAVGVVLVLATHLFAFFSQFEFYNQSSEELWRHQRTLRRGVADVDMTKEGHHNRRGNLHMVAGIVLLTLSLVCFILGCGLALAGVIPA